MSSQMLGTIIVNAVLRSSGAVNAMSFVRHVRARSTEYTAGLWRAAYDPLVTWSHALGIDSTSARQSPCSCEKMLGPLTRCDDGSASSVMACVDPDVIAM